MGRGSVSVIDPEDPTPPALLTVIVYMPVGPCRKVAGVGLGNRQVGSDYDRRPIVVEVVCRSQFAAAGHDDRIGHHRRHIGVIFTVSRIGG